MNLTEELEKLNALRQSGALSEEEYQKAKKTLLAQQQPPAAPKPALDENSWGVFIHLSQFLAYAPLPLIGIIAPIVLWMIKKDESPVIDKHGKIVLNWLISEFIYLCISGILVIVVIGLPMLIILGILGFIYPIIGAVKAGNGETWSYPGSIRFFK